MRYSITFLICCVNFIVTNVYSNGNATLALVANSKERLVLSIFLSILGIIFFFQEYFLNKKKSKFYELGVIGVAINFNIVLLIVTTFIVDQFYFNH